MHADEVPDQPPQLVGRVALEAPKMREVFTEADLEAVNLIGIQPDPLLRQLRVVVLGF